MSDCCIVPFILVTVTASFSSIGSYSSSRYIYFARNLFISTGKLRILTSQTSINLFDKRLLHLPMLHPNCLSYITTKTCTEKCLKLDALHRLKSGTSCLKRRTRFKFRFLTRNTCLILRAQRSDINTNMRAQAVVD